MIMPSPRFIAALVVSLCARGALVQAKESKMEKQTEKNLGFKGSAHGVQDADKPDTSDAVRMLRDEMKKVMDLEHDAERKFIATFPMQTLTQNEYEPAPGGIINSNLQANMARLTDVLHRDPIGGGMADPGDYNMKLSDLATKVLEFSKPVDPEALKKAMDCFETTADQIVNDLQLSGTIKSAMQKCAQEKVEGMRQYNQKFGEAREDCNEKIAGNVIQQAEQKQEVLEKIRICKEVESAATGEDNEVSPCGLKAIMDSSLDDKEKKKAVAQVKMNRANCVAEAKKTTMEFQNQVAHSMATCRNLVRTRNFALEAIRGRCDPDAAAIGAKLATIGKYRDQLSWVLNEHDQYNEAWARSSTQPDTIHEFFMDKHELQSIGIEGGADAGWTQVTKTFERSESSESKSSVTVTARGGSCFLGIVCVDTTNSHSKDEMEADSKNMKQLVSFKIRPLEITHSWFPFDIMNDETFLQETYAAGMWHVPYQWETTPWRTKATDSDKPLLAYRSKIIFCKDIRVSITSAAKAIMEQASKTTNSVNVRFPILGLSVKTDREKSDSEKQEKGQEGGIHFIVDGVGICGYVLTQLSTKSIPINEGKGEEDGEKKKEKAQQAARFDKAMKTLEKIDNELKDKNEEEGRDEL